MALRGGAGSPSDCGVGGFTLGSLDWFLLPVDPDTEELACLPVPRDPDPLRTAAAQGCQQPKPKTRSGTRAQKHARAQVFTNKCSRARRSMHEHKHSSQFPWRHEHCDASAPLLVRARAKCVALQPARFRASARPSGVLTTVPHITAAQAAGTGCSFDRCKAAATRDAPLVLPSPPPQSTRRGSARNLERAWDGTLADRLTRTSTLSPPRRTVR